MASVKVIDIIKRVETILQDENVRWKRLELQDWLNEAYLSIILARPDANTKVGTLSCVSGSRQNLSSSFSSALRLIDVVRNIAIASNQYGIRLVSRNDLDDEVPGWHASTETLNIQHYMFDSRLPKEFLVYPPALVGAELEVIYSSPVGKHALTENQLDPSGNSTDVILLDDTYSSSLVDWIIYRAFSKDALAAEYMQLATLYVSQFNQMLGTKSNVDSAANPGVQ